MDSLGYRLCLLDAMRIGIRRRDLFASPSLRFAGPRIGLLAGPAWEAARPSICRTLGLSTDGPAEIARLAERLDAAYQNTAANLPKNEAVQVDADAAGRPSGRCSRRSTSGSGANWLAPLRSNSPRVSLSL